MKISLLKSNLFISVLLLFAFVGKGNAQCSITGISPNASTYNPNPCTLLISCGGVLNVGNGTNPTNLIMNTALNLTCLGPIQLIVKNNASIDFSSGNDNLTLAIGSSIFFEGTGTLVGGSCNASERIYIGTDLIASCNGQGLGADYSFAGLVGLGGYNIVNVTPASASACGSASFSFTASAIPAAAATIRWYDASTGGNLLQTGVLGSSNTYAPSVLTTTTYYAEATIGTFTTPRKAVVANINSNVSSNVNTLTGTTWSLGTPPATGGTQNLVFNSNYTATTNLSGCSCTVNSGNVIINPGMTLTIANGVTVLGGTLTFEYTSSLVQINDAAINSGSIIYKRSTTTAREKDYTYWSSPVAGQTLYDVSPDTPSDYFYSFNSAGDVWAHESTSKVMDFGIGYIIRAPNAAVAPPGFFEALFEGVPNNGAKTIAGFVLDNTYLLGNPYPSAMSASAFLVANPVLYGTIYFWTHNTAPAIGAPNPGTGTEAYTGNDYAAYTRGTGGVTAVSGGAAPSGNIAAGQGFITIADYNGSVVFNNSMRITGNNAQFYKQSNKTKSNDTMVRNRIWLNLTNTQGLFKQTLVGYVTGATNGIDRDYDGESIDANQYADFYSIIEDKNLAIQGRALPFEDIDVVKLGYRSAIAGQLSIKIDHTDGILASQDVFIEDKMTKAFHNLKQSPYLFTTTVGIFDDRFVLRYTNRSSTPKSVSNLNVPENGIVVSNKNKQIKINSGDETIDTVFIYDLLGRQIYKKAKVNSNELSISNLNTSQKTIVVKIALQNGSAVTQKVMY